MRKFSILLLLSFFATAGFAQITVTTYAGDTAGYRDGASNQALFNAPAGVAVDTNGNVFVADVYNNRIRMISTTGTVNTIAGDTMGFRDGAATAALFNQPLGICTDKLGNIYVADTYNNAIRKISTTGVVTTIGGKGTDSAGYRNGADSLALFNLPVGVAIDAAGTLYVADNGNNVIRKIFNGTVSTFAGNDTIGYRNGLNGTAEFNDLGGIAVDDSGYVYVTEFGNNSVRKISKGSVVNIGGYDTLGIDTTNLSTYPGYRNGAADTSLFNSPVGIVVDHSGNVFVCDEYNNVIREISNGKVSTFAGSDSLVIPGFVNGPLDSAQFFQPVGIALDKNGALYVGDNGNNVVRRIGGPPLGIATITAKNLNMQVYPNPCNQQTYIASAPNGVAELLDLTGRVIWTNEHFKAPATLATDNISPGVYFLRIQSGMQTATSKIVVQH